MNILSLFDGMSCGQLALKKLGIEYDNYFASEIDKHAIKETQANFPNTIQLGDVSNLTAESLPKIDLLIGGSPCTSFSSSGKLEGFNGKSGLFWHYHRLLNETKPKYFLLENVVMKKEWEKIITEALGVEPILINSSLVSAQNRKRLYWTNIPNVTIPEDKNITLDDILENVEMLNPAAIRGRKLLPGSIIGRKIDEHGVRKDYDANIPYVQCLEVRETNTTKSNCLTTVEKDNVLTSLPIGRHPDVYKNNLPYRNYTLTEYCRLQNVPEDYFKVSSEHQAKKMLGNGWTVDVIAHILQNIKGS